MKASVLSAAASVVVGIALGGCGAASAVRIDVPVAESTSFAFVDDRSGHGRTCSKEELLLEDGAISPSPPELLKAWLQQRMASALAGTTVVLTNFDVCVTVPGTKLDPAGANAMKTTAVTSPVGALLALPIIVGLESSYSEKVVTARCAFKVNDRWFTDYIRRSYRGRLTESNIEETITEMLQRLTNRLAVDLDVQAQGD